MGLGELFQQHNFIPVKREVLRSDPLQIGGTQSLLTLLGCPTLIWENKKSVEVFAATLMFWLFSLIKVLRISMNKNEPQF